MTSEDLKKLSGAATPGEWRICMYDAGDVDHWSGVPMIVSDESDCGIVHWDGFRQRFWQSARGENEMQANAEFITALANSHRDGTMIHRDDVADQIKIAVEEAVKAEREACASLCEERAIADAIRSRSDT